MLFLQSINLFAEDAENRQKTSAANQLRTFLRAFTSFSLSSSVRTAKRIYSWLAQPSSLHMT